MSKTISELQEIAYRQSADKGFHDNEAEALNFLIEAGRPDLAAFVARMCQGNRIALQHSELSEALEELRAGNPANFTYYPSAAAYPAGVPRSKFKPEGVPSEMADVVIRVLDFCGANDIDLEAMIEEKLAYNATRPAMHGGKAF